jgi:hypothetical protein
MLMALVFCMSCVHASTGDWLRYGSVSGFRFAGSNSYFVVIPVYLRHFCLVATAILLLCEC